MVTGPSERRQNRNMEDGMKVLGELVNLLLKEVQIPTLQSLPFDTYQKIAANLQDLKVHSYESLERKVRDTMVELISSANTFLLEIRLQKIIDQQNIGSSSGSSVFSSLPPVSPSASSDAIDYSKLTEEEKYIFDAAIEFGKRKSETSSAVTRGRPKLLESISKQIRFKRIVVRFLKPIEQFMGVDMKKYGPFQKEDVAILPFENARALMESKHAMEVHIKLRFTGAQ
jgi:DNA replication factor GINS